MRMAAAQQHQVSGDRKRAGHLHGLDKVSLNGSHPS
jgi:hypothetical protein